MNSAVECWLTKQCNHKDCNGAFCLRRFKTDALYKESLLEEKQRNRVDLLLDDDLCDMSVFDNLHNVEAHVEDFIVEGGNLYLWSLNTGNGKTAWAIRIMQDYFNAIWAKTPLTCRALFINVPRFFLSLKDSLSNKNSYTDHIKQFVLSADLVVWDEVAIKSLTQFETENLLSMINNRLEARKANIYTSNISPQVLSELVGGRLYSRIVSTSVVYEFKGKDKRHLVEGEGMKK